MRVLLTHRPGGAYGFISEGWVNALTHHGHVTKRWDGNLKSWNDFDPDVYIGCSGHKQPIPSSRRCKVAIHVNPYGPVNVDGINEKKADIAWVVGHNPDAVFGYGHESDRRLWSYWKEREGISWVPMPTAGDRYVYDIDNQSDSRKKTDVIYLGGKWAYKGKSIDKYLIPALNDARISKTVHGWGDWPVGMCLGELPDSEVRGFLNSGRVGPCISEPHTLEYGFDLPERLFKVALCGALVVHDPVPGLSRYMPSAVVASSSSEFIDKIIYYSSETNTQERIDLVRRQRSEVLENHTYDHRVAGLLGALGFHDVSTSMLIG